LSLSAVFLALLTAAPCLLVARRAEAFFRYWTRKSLASELETNPDKWVDQDVTVTDELAYVFPADPAGELDTEKTQGTKCVRFDTVYFRCAIDDSKKGDYLEQIWAEASKGQKDVLDKLQALNEAVRKRTKGESEAEKERKDLYWELHSHWKNQPIVTVFGKVARVDFYTPSFYLQKNANEEFKGRPEPLTILCERVEKPRQRYYEYGLDDTDD
jgi:hypothetical protein